MNTKKLIQTYIFTDHGDYFVSTINRTSSAMIEDAPTYSETLVWEWDRKNKRRLHIVDKENSHENDIAAHLAIVTELFTATKKLPCWRCESNTSQTKVG